MSWCIQCCLLDDFPYISHDKIVGSYAQMAVSLLGPIKIEQCYSDSHFKVNLHEEYMVVAKIKSDQNFSSCMLKISIYRSDIGPL